MTKRRLIGAYAFLLAALAYRVFYIQELFFAFLLFAIAFLLLLLLVVAVFCALYVYARGMTYLALRISAQGIALCRSFAFWCSGLPHGHKNRSNPVSRTAHFVLSVLRLTPRMVPVFPPRCLAIPRGHRARGKALARPPQAQLTLAPSSGTTRGASRGIARCLDTMPGSP